MDLHPEIGDAFSFLLLGFGVVLLTLVALAVVCAAAGSLFKRYPALGRMGKEEKGAAKRSQRPPSAELDPQLLSVIGAAVDQSLGGRYRIRSVKPLERK